jgi:hypothetical protein
MIPWAWMAIEYLQTGEFNIMSGTEEFAEPKTTFVARNDNIVGKVVKNFF